ncbi:MAG: glutathione S-transferase family protein [Alphaproteobacteria bacterium]|jgi:glutathione S-transferase|nr:glutathione S-transferase family protein [Alphaproteobacteria bacterium]MBT4085922.1 glutathione S-transferase family protein [Alphaproteobacteria bacterium]MBT4542605.1 glutathione S-transferase family protein [Alphaproteobacteria bacterium]MBT7746809.1 glutathione S-transferase family protein [Alphaproteobacteria bacterium]
MLEIYAIPVSLYCAKLRILLRHKGLAWQEQPPPGGYGSDEYKQTVASGNLPALRDGDLLLADGEAIAEYLNDKHPDPAMLPDNIADRARIRERSRFHDTRLEPALRKLFPTLNPALRDVELAKTQSLELTTRLAQLAAMLADDLVAPDWPHSDLTLADCGFPITFAWIDALTPVMGLQVTWPDAVLAYRGIIETFPAVAAELDDYQPKLAAYLASL